jgi:hypothetical protein
MSKQTIEPSEKYDRIEIEMPEDVELAQVEGNESRVLIFEFSGERGRMTEVDKRNGKIYGEGIENYWFDMRTLDSCPAFDRRKGLQFYFNLDKQNRVQIM